ncbi:hypothetical protein PGT21_015971 [Puccinia graminis f. sp. tritici]|uniref:Integrase zinc-binding domain-containing protein n=1 Tax=Puccinia graminis f. sp. tritici TaxID=56615 RepID=A0A5B0QFD7_PUCGR|nr:hypothetical protein PGT21_015971 [Puccinia graminis f. sp. tritici]
MSFPLNISTAQPNRFVEAPATGVKQNALASCIDGSDGYPTLQSFTSHMETYLSGKKRADRTVITSADLHQIHRLLLDPAALRADPNPSNRAWVKKTFFLEPTPSGTIVCHREKGQHIGRPVAVKELMYFILKEAHASEGHGGRDKTAKAVKNTHSYIRKGLICIFLETCPTCQTRIDAVKKEKNAALAKSLNIRGSMFQSVPQSVDFTESPYFAINKPTIPPELALVPAAPKPYSRSRNASYPSESYSNLRKGQRMLSSGSNLGGYLPIPTRPLLSPSVIMPNTAIASDFSSQDPSDQRKQRASSNYNSATSITQGLAPNAQNPESFLSEPSAWSYQPQTPIFSLGNRSDNSSWEIEFANIWSGNEPNFYNPIPAPLLAPQPQFSASERLKIPFTDQYVSSDNNNLQFNSWSSVSPMTNVFPG